MFTAGVLETHAYGIEIYILFLIIAYLAQICKKKPDLAEPDVFVHIVASLNQV